MAINEFIKHISQSYLMESKKSFAKNELASYIRHEPRNLMPDFAKQKFYKIASSSGQAKWAMVPWVGIFDKEISSSAVRGYYIVYLFTEDMKGVYLSLNQGWEFYIKKYPKPKETIKRVAAYWKKELSTIPNDFSIVEIYLKSYKDKKTSGGRPDGYANGNICSKYYEIDNLPKEEYLVKDLFTATLMLTELKSKLLGGDYEKTNSFILTQHIPQLVTLEAEREQIISAMQNDINNAYEFEKLSPPPASIRKSTRNPQISNNVDYVSAQSRNKKIGFAGELAVLELERQKLKLSPNPTIQELADKIRHVSVEDGDGLGYDIRSFNKRGEEIYIEVKTTTQGINTPFYLTANELVRSKEYDKKYYLYRLIEFGRTGKKIKYYILNGALDDVADLKPITYSVSPK